jgi:RNA polymerase sigma-70 factor (ECF subfamily)
MPAPRSGDTDAEVDRWLVGKASNGDIDAFELLVHRHRRRVYPIALRIVGNPQDAEDVTQDVFVQVWATLAGFLGNSTFTTWLYRMVVNRSLNHRQRGRTTQPLLDRDPRSGEEPADEVIAAERVSATAHAIAELPADQRAVFVLYQLEGLSYAEICGVLRLPEPTVRGRLSRARRTLVDQLRDWA